MEKKNPSSLGAPWLPQPPSMPAPATQVSSEGPQPIIIAGGSDSGGVERVEPQTEGLVTQYRPPDNATARWAFDYTDLYWELKAKLYGGWITTDNKGFYIIMRPTGVEPYMNAQGVEATMALINGFVSKIQAISNYDTEERIYEKCRFLHEDLAALYTTEMDNFGLTYKKASAVIHMICDIYEANLRKSLGAESMRLLGTTERIVEHRAEEPRRKFLGII